MKDDKNGAGMSELSTSSPPALKPAKNQRVPWSKPRLHSLGQIAANTMALGSIEVDSGSLGTPPETESVLPPVD